MLTTIKSFYFIRHGESEANAMGFFSGHLDVALTERGRGQIQNIADNLDSLHPSPDAIFHSGLQRTQGTAIILNSVLSKPLKQNMLLKEQHYGLYQGQPKTPIKEQNPDFWKSPPQGETFDIFTQRAFKGLIEVMNACETPLIAGHGGFLKAVVMHYTDKPYNTDNGILYFFKTKETKEENTLPWKVMEYDTKTRGFAPSAINDL